VAAATLNDRRVLISGAGIAGLTLAVLLKERGFEPLVVERDPGIRAQGYMMDFFGSGWDIAERMGLVDDLSAIKYPIDRMEFVDRGGTPYLAVPIDRLRQALGGRYVFLRRSDLERILHERALRAGVEIRFATTVEALEATDDAVEATLSSGETESFDLVFGADGLHSAIRALTFGEEGAFTFFLGGYVAAFHLEQTRLELNGAFKLQEEIDRIVGFYPLGGGAADATFVFRHPDDGYLPAERRLPLLQEKWAGPGWIGKSVLQELPASIPVFFDALTQIRMPNWHHGRVALLGDACGCLTLLAGQGSHMAMAGAYVLATELHRDAGYEAAFRAYKALMAPAVMKRQIEAERFARIAMPTEKSRPWLRRIATQLLFSRPGLQFAMQAFGAKSVLEGYS
jgi:2-polyprenyl-6-methoxyphenol hydroxylase-like FAD-dependent oxidoreductase